MFRKFFRTARPLQSEKVKHILKDQNSKKRFLKALDKMRGGQECASFKNGEGYYRIKLTKDIPLNKHS